MLEKDLVTGLAHDLLVLRLKFISEAYNLENIFEDEEDRFFRPWEMGEENIQRIQELYIRSAAHLGSKFPAEAVWSGMNPLLNAHMQKDHSNTSNWLLHRLEYLYHTDVVLTNPQSNRPVDYSAWMSWTKSVPIFIKEAYEFNVAQLTQEETPNWKWVDALMTPFDFIGQSTDQDPQIEMEDSGDNTIDLPVATLLDRLEFLGKEFGHIFFPDGSLRRFRRAEAEQEDEEDIRECYRLNLESFGQNAPQDWSVVTVVASTEDSDELDDEENRETQEEVTETYSVENLSASVSTASDEQVFSSEEVCLEEEEEEEEEPVNATEETAPTVEDENPMNVDHTHAVQFDTPTLINHTFIPRTHETVYIVVNEEKTAVVSACNNPLGALEYRVVSLPNQREVIATQLENAALFYTLEDARDVAALLQKTDPQANYTVHTLVRKQIVYYALETT